MMAAILSPSLWFLNFVHVMTGALWTGIDLFMGFIIGPVLRHVSFDARRAMIRGLIPRTLILMPTLSAITSTSGWFLAVRMGFLDLGYPEFWWVIAALAIGRHVARESRPAQHGQPRLRAHRARHCGARPAVGAWDYPRRRHRR
jgi:hypothetical protein